MKGVEVLKGSAVVLAGSALSIPLFTGETFSLGDKFDRIEVVINVKKKDGTDSDTTPITLKISIDSPTNVSKAQYKKNGTDGNGGEFEDVERADETEKAKYSHLAKLAGQFLSVQHKINLIKSHRWIRDDEKSKFDEVCSKCCTKQKKQTCAICMCCGEKCAEKSKKDCCCKKDATDSCKWELNKDSIDGFFHRIRNLNTANINKYLSPVKAVLTVHQEADGDNENGSFWGSLIYGFVNYRYKAAEAPTENETLGNSVDSNTNSNDKYYANVPQKYTFKKDGNENTIDKLLEKLEKKDEMKKLMDGGKDSTLENLCACCGDSEIECMIKRNYSIGFSEANEIKTKVEDKIKDLKMECCKAT